MRKVAFSFIIFTYLWNNLCPFHFQTDSHSYGFILNEQLDDLILAGNLLHNESGSNLDCTENNVRSTPVKKDSHKSNSSYLSSPGSVLETSYVASPGSFLENSPITFHKSKMSSHSLSVNNYPTDHVESTGSFLESSCNGESALEDPDVTSPDVSVLESLQLKSSGFRKQISISLSPASSFDNSHITISHVESPASLLESSLVTPPGSIHGTSGNFSLLDSHITSAGSIQLTSPFGGSVLESSFVSDVSKISI